MHDRPMDKIFLSKKEAVKRIGVGEKVFNRLKIPYCWIGRRKMYVASDLEIWASSQPRYGTNLACFPKKKVIRRPRSSANVIDIEDALRLTGHKNFRRLGLTLLPRCSCLY